MTAKHRKLPDITADPRVVELANCLCFAIGGFRNRLVYDPKTKRMETWHAWFRRAIKGAGFKITEHP